MAPTELEFRIWAVVLVVLVVVVVAFLYAFFVVSWLYEQFFLAETHN